MKLSDYLPKVPKLEQTVINMNEQINFLELMKSAGETGTAPTIALDHVVNTWVRHQMARINIQNASQAAPHLAPRFPSPMAWQPLELAAIPAAPCEFRLP